MRVWLDVRPYRRKFLRPLRTAHGVWEWRQGLLFRLRSEAGRVSFGEVAPVPGFRCETMADIQPVWWKRAGWWEDHELLATPDDFPATQFGLGAALADLTGEPVASSISRELSLQQICALLPAGHQALAVCPALLAQGHRTLKWKVGVDSVEQELAWLETLLELLPQDSRLRLDANGGLTVKQAEAWLQRCDSIPGNAGGYRIEFLEQPLPPEQFGAMRQLAERFETAIALDESVSTVRQMEQCDRASWPGLYVIKPAIAGFPHRLQAFLQTLGNRAIFSSAFETVVGRQAALGLAMSHYRDCCPGQPFPALGFGTLNYFDDDWHHLNPAQLWEQI